VLPSALNTIAAASVGAPAAGVAMISVNPTSRPVADPPETIGGLRDRELEMSVHCLRCGRIRFLWDRWFDRWIRQHGDLPLAELARRARCKQCGHRSARIEVTEPLLRAAGWKPRAPT
jgi:DNA-directed RNA polymerase subunit RPC12/RpoP